MVVPGLENGPQKFKTALGGQTPAILTRRDDQPGARRDQPPPAFSDRRHFGSSARARCTWTFVATMGARGDQSGETRPIRPTTCGAARGLLAFSTLVIFVNVVLVALVVPMPRRFRAISRGGRSQSSRGPSRSSRSRRGLSLSSRSRGRSRSNHGLIRSSCQRSQSRCGRSLSRRGLSLSMRSRGRGRSNRATRRSSRQRSQSSSSENIQRSRRSSTVEGRSQQSRRRSSRVEGPAEPKVQQQPAAPRRSSRVEGRPHLKVNDQELSVGDATKYFGEYGHVSAIWGNPKGGLPYTVAVRRDDIHKDRANLLLYVTIDPSIPISSDSDCKEFKNPPLPSVSKRKKVGGPARRGAQTWRR